MLLTAIHSLRWSHASLTAIWQVPVIQLWLVPCVIIHQEDPLLYSWAGRNQPFWPQNKPGTKRRALRSPGDSSLTSPLWASASHLCAPASWAMQRNSRRKHKKKAQSPCGAAMAFTAHTELQGFSSPRLSALGTVLLARDPICGHVGLLWTCHCLQTQGEWLHQPHPQRPLGNRWHVL